MEKELEAFNNEIDQLKRIINGYLSTNPVLSRMELLTLGIAPKEDFMKPADSDMDKEVNFAVRVGGGFAASCKICRDANGNTYCYYGSGGCPKV